LSRILVGAGALEEAASDLGQWVAGRTVFVLSTPRVRSLCGDRLSTGARDGLLSAARRVVDLEVEDGEGAKTLTHCQRLWRQMVVAGGKRDSRLIALGGGTVGDLGGFLAGCFLRGIAYTQIPTTLLAQVDASVGGKTGVDLPEGKNTVGLFHHPDWVVADTTLLATLDAGELRAGLVEAIKMAFLLDPPLLGQIEQRLDRLLAADATALGTVVAGAVAVKQAVVERDPEEANERRLLNFGHTLGHAIESALDYQGLRHGEAVGYGLLFALRLAQRRGFDPAAAARLRSLLARLELPPLPDLDVETLQALMARDKKAREKGLVWVLPKRLGAGQMVTDLDPAWVGEELRSFLTDPWAAAVVTA
jgi:3-dehydroquinate synthase